MGALVGGLIATFLVRGLLLLVIPRSDEDAITRYAVANTVSFFVAMSLYAFGSADGGLPNWGGGVLYIVPQAIWFLVDVVRVQARQAATTATTQAAPAVTSPAIAAHNPEPLSDRTRSGALASPAASSTEASQGELAFWQSVKDSTRASDFEAYLRQFPQGLFRLIARSRLIALGGTPPSEEIAPPAISAPPASPAASSGSKPQASNADIQSAWLQIEESVVADDYTDFAAAFPGTNHSLQALRRARQVRAWTELEKSQPAQIDEFLKSGIFPALQSKVMRFLEAGAPSNAGFAALLTRYQEVAREAQRHAEEAARVLEEQKRADAAFRAAADTRRRRNRSRWAAILVLFVMAAAGTGTYFIYDYNQKVAVALQAEAAFERADYSEALRLYRLAADQGYAGAQNNLAHMYWTGRGVANNEVEAVRWYRLAAAQGHTGAQASLANICSARAELCR